MEHGAATPPHRRRAGPVRRRVSADAGPARCICSRRHSIAKRPRVCTATSRIRRPTQFPLALISPASEKSVSSTLAELRQRAAVLQMNPADAAARGLATDDPVRVFNELGEVHCPVALNKDIRPGTVSLPKGLWRKSTYNGMTSNALVPDTLTDIGGGACFNDARVQVASLGRH